MRCDVNGCERDEKLVRGMCRLHYARWRRQGNPLVKRRARGVMDAPVVTYRQLRQEVQPPMVRGRWKMRPAEVAVLVRLAERGTLRYEELCEYAGLTPLSLSVTVSRIRARFGYDVIETVRDYGYRLADPSGLLEMAREAL